MKDFVESIKRLYVQGAITPEKIQELASCGKITEPEMYYILGSR